MTLHWKSETDHCWSSCCGSAVTDLTSIHKDVSSIPGLAQCIKDPALLWLRYRMVAIALIGPLAWEIPYAVGIDLKRKKKKRKKKRKQAKQLAMVEVCTPQKSVNANQQTHTSSIELVVLGFFCLSSLGPLLRHIEIPRPGVELEP